jgi:hypothetical protein
VSEAHETREIRDAGAIMEDLGGHAIAFALMESATRATADDTGRVLAAMLEEI